MDTIHNLCQTAERAIQERILDPLAMRLLNGDIQSGATVSLDVEPTPSVWQVEA